MKTKKGERVMQQIKYLMNDRRGSTLIEIVVSVLIVGIAFVPLMMGLNASLKANRDTESKLYAENVAANVIEVAKTYGEKGLQELAEKTYDDINTIFDDATLVRVGTTSEYRITDITAGTNNKYRANITFDTTPYDGADKQNDYSRYPSISSVNNAVVVSFNGDALGALVNQFYAIAQSKGSAITEDAMLNNVDDWLIREMKVTIEPGTEPGKFVVKKVVNYTGKANSSVGGVSVFQEAGFTPTIPGTEEEVGTYSAFPTNMIVTFNQLKDGTDAQKMNSDSLIINKKVTGEIYVYALCGEASELSPSAGFGLDVSQIGTDTNKVSPVSPLPEGLESDNYNVKIYCNIPFTCSQCDIVDKFGMGGTGKQSLLKDVIVEIYDENGTKVMEKKSTMVEFE